MIQYITGFKYLSQYIKFAPEAVRQYYFFKISRSMTRLTKKPFGMR